MSIRHLDRLLLPTSIALIGASDRPASVGATVWRNLRAGGFAGPVWAVNPGRATLDGQPVFARVADLPEAPDLAVICTPPATVPGLIDELGRRGTRAAVVMTAGLDGATRQAMLSAARPHLLRILGPNCLGLLTPRIGLNASFAHVDALPGEIAFVSQSGALVTAVLDWARTRGIGFSHLVSLGERSDADFGDLLDVLASDPHTRAILLYIESIEAPRKFMSAARAAARNKPVIVVKAGRAGNGVKAAASHTGALAGSDVVFDAAIRRAGMLRVDTLQELFTAAETLARFGRGAPTRLTLMTNGGGAGVMAADAAALAGLPLQDLDPALRDELDAILPPTWSRANPIDIIGDAPVARYTGTLQALLARPEGAVLFMHAPTAIVRSDDIARACAPFVRAAPGRVMACWLGDSAVADARRILEGAGAADYATPEEAIRAFTMLQTYHRNQALLLETPEPSDSAAPDRAAARALVAQALASGRTALDEQAAKQLLKAYGIPVVETVTTAPDPQAAADAASQLGFPVVLKILSPQLSHKSDLGGVVLNLRDAGEVAKAARTMLDRIGAARPDAQLLGFTVQPMVVRPRGRELIVGASVDAVFGPVILFGQGGTAVEVVADRAIALPPLNRVLATELIGRTRVSKLLAAWRDRPAAQIDAIADVLIALSELMADLPELAELDINPLIADETGVVALDARVRLDPQRGAGAARFAVAPYPAALAGTVEWEGEALLLRPVRPEDGPQHEAFLAQIDPADLRLRFFGTRRQLPRSEIARLTQIDYDREIAFIAVRSRPGEDDQTLGVARAAIDPDNIETEFAIIVRSDLKGRGLGHLLLNRTVDVLRARGTRRMIADVLPENDAMKDLALTNGFTLDRAASSSDALRYVRELN